MDRVSLSDTRLRKRTDRNFSILLLFIAKRSIEVAVFSVVHRNKKIIIVIIIKKNTLLNGI